MIQRHFERGPVDGRCDRVTDTPKTLFFGLHEGQGEWLPLQGAVPPDWKPRIVAVYQQAVAVEAGVCRMDTFVFTAWATKEITK